MRQTPLLIACLAALLATDTHAHGGGLNAEGCHNNRKTGDYHCHRGGSGGSPRAPSRAPALDLQNDAPLLSPTPRGGSRPRGAFRNCDAAGAAPVHRGDPGYGPHLDRDGDGIGCEPYRGR